MTVPADGNDDGSPLEATTTSNNNKQEKTQMSLSSDEVNYLVFRYLQECGFVHSAFSFAHESMLGNTGLRSADKTLPPGALVTFLQKGLQYVGIEERLRAEGSSKEGGKEGIKKSNSTTTTAATSNNNSINNSVGSDLPEFSLLSQTAISAVARRDPPLQLNIPPATAAAAVKARLEAEAKIQEEREVAQREATRKDGKKPEEETGNENGSSSHRNDATAMDSSSSTQQQLQHPPNSQQQPSSAVAAVVAAATASGGPTPSTTPPPPGTAAALGLSDHSAAAANNLARQQAIAAQAMQLQQQQQQLAAEQLAAEQMAAAAGAPLSSIANAFGPPQQQQQAQQQQQSRQATAADLLALQQAGATPAQLAAVTEASSLADAMAIASQQQQQQQQGGGAVNAQAQAPSAKRGGGGAKRGTKRKQLHNDDVQRITDTIAGLQAQAQGLPDLDLNQRDTSTPSGTNPSTGGAPPTPMELEQVAAAQQQQQVDFRSQAGQQEFRPIQAPGAPPIPQEQYLNGQIVSTSDRTGGKSSDHRENNAHGMNGDRMEGIGNNTNGGGGNNNSGSTTNNVTNKAVVNRMDSNESMPNANPEDVDTDTPNEHILKLEMHESEVFMCAWNPVFTDLIATGSGDASARIWQVGGKKAAAGLTTVKLLPHGSDPRDRKNKDVTTLEWSSDGTLLATGSYDGVARVWARNGALIHTLRGHTGPIFSLKWNGQGNFLLSGSYDKTTIVWDVSGTTGFVEQQFTEHQAPALDVDWKDNTTFASCSTDKTVHICRVGVSRPLKVYVGHSDEVNAVKWDPSGRLLASCSDDCTAKIWDVESERSDPLYDLKSHEQEIYTVKWSPTGPKSKNPTKKSILATASFDGSVRLWSVADGSCYRVFNRHKDSVYSVAFSPSGDYLASGSLAGQMYVWDIEKAKHIKSYKGKGDIFEVAWNKEETRVAACFSSNVVAIVDFNRPPPGS